MRTFPRLAALLFLFSCAIAAEARAQGGDLRVIAEGSEIPSVRVRSLAVDSDSSGVDAATVVVMVPRRLAPAVGAALDVESSGGDGPDARVFQGEIVGVEPIFEPGRVQAVVVRAFNKLHRLTRGRKSRTFEKQSDAEIAARIAAEAGLGFAPSGPEAGVTREYVLQHNETDLDFLRSRAARIGYSVWVEDTKLHFRRRPGLESVEVGCGPVLDAASAGLRTFHPRLSSSSVVKKVTVRGWNPEKKEEIVGEATRARIALSPGAAAIVEPPGPELDLGDVPALETAESTYGAATGALAALTASDLSAEADTDGHASLRVGAEVTLAHPESRFDGKYLVVGVSHRFEHRSDDGWHTLLRLVRADRGFYALPEVGDEVLVAFEHGDIQRPIVVGSLWNETDGGPQEARVCGDAGSN